MPYTSRAINFDDSSPAVPPDSASSPQHQRAVAVQDRSRREGNGEDGRIAMDDSEESEGDSDSLSVHNNSVSKAMAKQTCKRVNPPKRLVFDSIVVSRWKDIRPKGPHVERNPPSSSRVQDGSSSSAQKTDNIKLKSVQRTYSDRRTIKSINGISTTGQKRKRSPTRLETDDSRTSSPVPPPDNDDDASSDYDSSSDVLLLTGKPSRARSSRDVERHSSSGSSSSSPPPPNTRSYSFRSRPSLPMSHRNNEPKTKPSKTSKGSDFYASLSNAYNFARQCVLEKKPTARRPEKSQSPRSQSTQPQPPQSSRSIQVHNKSIPARLQSTSQSRQPSLSSSSVPPIAHQRPSIPCQTFAFVLIPPPLFPVPREQYRSIAELEADEEEDVHEREKAKEVKDREVREERPKQGIKRKRGRPPKRSLDERLRGVAEHAVVADGSEQERVVKEQDLEDKELRQGILLKRKPGRPPKRALEERGKEKEEPARREAFYVSSHSEASVADLSKRAPTSSIHAFNRFRNQGVERDDTIVVDSNIEDVSSSPKPTAKRMRKRRRLKRVISESPSDSESEFEVEAALLNTHPTRRSTPPSGRVQSIQSGDLSRPLSTNPKSVASQISARSTSITPERPTKAGKKQRTRNGNDSITTEPCFDEVADRISPNEGIEKAVDNSRSIFETSQHDSSESSPAPPSREIVVQHQAPVKDVHDRRHHQSLSMRQRSPTLHPSSSRSPSSRSTTLTEQVGLSYSPSDSPKTDVKSKTSRVRTPTKVAGVDRQGIMDGVPEEEDDHDDDDDYNYELALESEDEMDDVCHYCRSRNVYAKMKCTNMKDNGVCPLHYCHRCCLKFFPKIHFDPFSGTFVCPSCDNTCSCISCCKRRRVPEPRKPPQARLRYYELGATLLLSAQETRRQERRKQLEAAGRPDLAKLVGQNQRIKRRPRLKARVEEPKCSQEAGNGRRKVDIGEDAEEWFKQRNLERAKQSSGKTTTSNNSVGRAFLGAWSRAWGPAPDVIHEMDGVDVDVHAVDGMGKGKAKCVDQGRRLYVGDPKGLFRPFVRADNVVFTKSKSKPKPNELMTKQSPVRRRKLSPSEVVHDSIVVTSGPRKKRRRVGNPFAPIDSITIPQFTINHQEASATASSSTDLSSQPTPDDFGHPEIVDGDGGDNTNACLRYPRIVNDPMLSGVGDTSDGLGYGPAPVSGFWSENGVEMADGNIKEMNAYAPDWDSLDPTTSKKVEPSTTLFGDGEAEPEFSYDGVYDEYAAALGITREESMFNRERRVSQELPIIKVGGGSTTTNVSRDGPSKTSDTPVNIASIIDPALLAEPRQQQQSTSHPTSSHLRADSNVSPTSPSDPDPSRFLTAHALSSTDFISAPMIYGIPSSTGLSLDDLERTVREAVSTVGTGEDGCE